MSHLLSIFVAGLLARSPVQVVVGADAQEATAQPTAAELVARLADDALWFDAHEALVRAAIDGRGDEVSDALTSLEARDERPRVHERVALVVAAINRHVHAVERRARTKESVAQLRGAIESLTAATRARHDSKLDMLAEALATALEEVESTVDELEQTDPEFGEQAQLVFQFEDGTTRVLVPVGSKVPPGSRISAPKRAPGAKEPGSAVPKSDAPDEPPKSPAPEDDDPPRDDDRRGPWDRPACDAPIGDADKIEWVRPFARARELAAGTHRVLLVKPILGGSNRPFPSGRPCGGKEDCEGSW